MAFLIGSFLFLILSPEVARFKIFDINSDSSLFHPFVQNIRNYRSKDYLIKLLKRNLEQKLRKNRKLYEDGRLDSQERENANFKKHRCECDCKCEDRDLAKRCERCDEETPSEKDQFKNFVCENEGSFANPRSCQQFYVCFHDEKEPIEVSCPRGFAYDSGERKCTRKAARGCRKRPGPLIKTERTQIY